MTKWHADVPADVDARLAAIGKRLSALIDENPVPPLPWTGKPPFLRFVEQPLDVRPCCCAAAPKAPARGRWPAWLRRLLAPKRPREVQDDI